MLFRSPIAAEVRKVEAEVGPIKYIAQFVYGETNEGLLEKAVTWVIIILIVVFDPLAVILLLSSQISFQNFREREDPNEKELQEFADAFNEVFEEDINPDYEPDDGPLTDQQIEQIKKSVDPHPPGWMYQTDIAPIYPSTEEELEELMDASIADKHPYLKKPFSHFENLQPMVHKPEPTVVEPLPQVESESLFVQNEEQKDSNLWTKTAVAITPAEYVEASEEHKKEQLILYWANLVRTKQVTMADIPKHLLLEVRARV